ncbi:peptidyl-prolyl cis-trans isomerase [Silvanigrella paludirubra]|uniref:Peptidyl-prolyl cis-trans isomerase n=1 Tax=Silvanigrella paludirubra TaxID=2499159 RepID=A0A6N6VZ49_9BACT|nr:peptidylprolyl isomerase [Silvanigrella paludirubra]KAB8039728.1 peptidyl-prolyl cis-trans isomerase [Silvanigrella paludirubra]
MFQKFKISLVLFNLLFVIPTFDIHAAVEKKAEVKKEKTVRKKKLTKQQKNQNQQKNLALSEPSVPKGDIEVVILTSKGKIRLDLFKEKDPLTVNNFIQYVKAGYYNNTIFHRIVDGFIIQGGAYDVGFNEKPPLFEPIKNTSFKGLKNTFGTIAMARKQSSPDSATSQFFINLSNNSYLDYTKEENGYAVFGKVLSGMEIIQKIAKQKIGQREGMYNVPFYTDEALISSVYVVEPQ